MLFYSSETFNSSKVYPSLNIVLPCYTRQMVVIGIGGAGSGVGKTYVACQIIRALKENWASLVSGQGPGGPGAVKVTPDPLYTSITDDPAVINEPGKDTALMAEAGADATLWVRASRDAMKDAVVMAMDRLSGHEILVVEGNSAIEVLKPSIVLFVTRGGGPMSPEKDISRRVMALSDVVIHNGQLPPEVPEGAQKYSRDEAGAYTAHVLSLIKGA